MIEAANSVLAQAPLIRGQVEQQSTARNFAANPNQVQVAPQAPYISPYVHVDVNHDKAVLQIRDPDTGDVVRQIPSEPMLEAMRRQSATIEARRSEVAADTARQTRVQAQQEPVQVQVDQPAPQQSASSATQQQFAAFASAANIAAASQSTTTVNVYA